jgi:hypothetical protein
MLPTQYKRNLFLSFLFAIGFIIAHSHPFLLTLSLITLCYNFFKVVYSYRQTEIEAEAIKKYLKDKWVNNAKKTNI